MAVDAFPEKELFRKLLFSHYFLKRRNSWLEAAFSPLKIVKSVA
jgi:hypothetical protein